MHRPRNSETNHKNIQIQFNSNSSDLVQCLFLRFFIFLIVPVGVIETGIEIKQALKALG